MLKARAGQESIWDFGGWVHPATRSGHLVLFDGTRKIICEHALQPESFPIPYASVLACLRREGPDRWAVIQLQQLRRGAPLTDAKDLDRRHLGVRSERLTAVQRIRACVLRACREFLWADHWCEVSPPVLTKVTEACEDLSTLFSLRYYDGDAFLCQTAQLHLEALVYFLEKVFSINPSFRQEKQVTTSHLTEFWQVECEAAFWDLDNLVEYQTLLVRRLADALRRECTESLATLGVDDRRLREMEGPYARITYSEAVEVINRTRSFTWGGDFGRGEERLVTAHCGGPVFITHFPKDIKAFYMKRAPNRPDVVLSVDLVAPGIGEVTGGSVREEREDEVRRQALTERQVERIRRFGGDPDDYSWYFDLRSTSGVPHSGFGLGVERLVQWICGLDSIYDAVPFPRAKDHLYP